MASIACRGCPRIQTAARKTARALTIQVVGGRGEPMVPEVRRRRRAGYASPRRALRAILEVDANLGDR